VTSEAYRLPHTPCPCRWGGGCREGRRGFFCSPSRTPADRGPRAGTSPRAEARVQSLENGVMGISQSRPGSFSGLFCSGFIGPNVKGPCITSDEGAGAESPMCPGRTEGDIHGVACALPTTLLT